MNTKLIILEETESTQDIAREMALSGDPEGVAVMARRQTRGRGRLGRSWVSPPGKNLAISIILRPHALPNEAPLLSLMAGVAVAETLEEHGVASPQLRWPNDVLVSGRKISGIISDGTLTLDSLELAVIGIGLNVNTDQNDFPPELKGLATSVLLATGRSWSPEEAAHRLLYHLRSLYLDMKERGYGTILPLWEARWAHRGQVVARGALRGIAERVDPDGALVIRTGDGCLHRVSSGEVTAENRS